MASTIHTLQSSRVTSEISPFILEESGTTRKIVYAKIVDNPRDKDAYIHCVIAHERKTKKGDWVPAESINLASLKSGEGVRLDLSSAATKALADALNMSYAIGRNGIPKGNHSLIVGEENEVIIAKGREKEYIKKLLAENYGEEIWRQLIESNPRLATKLSLAQIQLVRQNAIIEMRNMLGQNKDEIFWQHFISRNDWVFGYGLSYYCLSMLNEQVLLGGKDLLNNKGQVVDFLASSNGNTHYTVLVEIKRPNTHLIGRQTRNRAFPISSDLAEAVAQLQGYCETWGSNSSQSKLEYEYVNKLTTAKPKGILVIGNTMELDSTDKKRSFELFRKGLNQIDIITYDELYSRASFIIGDRTAIFTYNSNMW